MTVGELKAALSEFSDDMPVAAWFAKPPTANEGGWLVDVRSADSRLESGASVAYPSLVLRAAPWTDAMKASIEGIISEVEGLGATYS
jgi:hypothetical protein